MALSVKFQSYGEFLLDREDVSSGALRTIEFENDNVIQNLESSLPQSASIELLEQSKNQNDMQIIKILDQINIVKNQATEFNQN